MVEDARRKKEVMKEGWEGERKEGEKKNQKRLFYLSGISFRKLNQSNSNI